MAAGGAPRNERVSLHLGVTPHSADPTVLPAELVTQVLGYLPNASLRQAAGVSRQFYACAWDAGLYIHRRLIVNDSGRFHRQLADLNDLVQHALPKNLRLGLTFSSFSFRHDGEPPRVDDTLPLIASALPLLVFLSVQVDKIDQAIGVLSQPMPRLRELQIMRIHEDRLPLPRNLLSGQAALLRKLELANFDLGTSPLPAFSNVRKLRFVYDVAPVPNLAFSRHFPALCALSIQSYAAHHSGPSSPYFNLTGLSLNSLEVEDETLLAVQHAIATDSIPILYCINSTRTINWLEPKTDSSDFSLRLDGRRKEDISLFVIVVPSHCLWRRIYHMYSWLPRNAFPLADKPGGVARLTYLRLDNVYLHSILSYNAAFPALKDIHVDFYLNSAQPALVWPPDTTDPAFAAGLFCPVHKTAPTFDNTESPYDVPCPALEELRLFALDDGVTVQSREVAFLGRALGQLSRAKHEKATLALVGVQFALPEALVLTGLTFSTVRQYGFSARNSADDVDDALWDQTS